MASQEWMWVEVKPDDNDAERARASSGRAPLSLVAEPEVTLGAQLVTMMFSFLATMRLQGMNAVAELFNHLERSPPPLPSS